MVDAYPSRPHTSLSWLATIDSVHHSASSVPLLSLMPHNYRALEAWIGWMRLSDAHQLDVTWWWNNFKRRRPLDEPSPPKSQRDIASYYELTERSKARVADWFLIGAPRKQLFDHWICWCKWPGLARWSPNEMGLRTCTYRSCGNSSQQSSTDHPHLG